MMMPVYPGAPWLPKFKGPGDDLKLCDWKEQMEGLLGSQELTEPRRVAIVLGALAGEAKRQVSVLEDDEKDTARKFFAYLCSLYGDQTPTSVVRSQFFCCAQKPGETVQSFVLRLRELYCRLRRHGDPPSEAALRDQLLLGLREGPMTQALKVYARRHPDADFAALREEALLLDSEYGSSASEVTCSIVNNKSSFSKEPYSDWKETLKRDIMEEVKAEMKGLAQELIRELKPHLSPVATASEPPVTPRSYYRSPPRNQRDERETWEALARCLRHLSPR
ncbi:unnamed protein product [Knipowitschia caucasica]